MCMRMFVKFLRHASFSLLERDDVRLQKDMIPISSRFCEFCGLASVEDVRHFLLQCHIWQDEWDIFSMKNEITCQI